MLRLNGVYGFSPSGMGNGGLLSDERPPFFLTDMLDRRLELAFVHEDSALGISTGLQFGVGWHLRHAQSFLWV